jgi:putative two-component system response regulator
MNLNERRLRTILIVDDTAENVSLLEAILAAEYLIRTASRGGEALEIAREVRPDLILLDIMMPEMSGYEVCEKLKADPVTASIPVIFVTALLSATDEVRGFEAGCVDYITKPVVAATVRSRVKAQLALRDVQVGLEEWNCSLKKRVLQNIAYIRQKTSALMTDEEHAAGLQGYVLSVELLSGVFELMENHFGVSARAVSEMAGDAARKLHLPAEMVVKIRLAALLHNVGTLGTRRTGTDKKEAEMTTNERAEYFAHPVAGEKMFEGLTELQDVALMVRGHHEMYDGNGFPDGLRGADIPLGARLIAIADCIEHAAGAVTTDRDEYALMMARRHGGESLDPTLVNYFTMITRIMYFDRKSGGTTGEIEVPVSDVITGMQLSRDISNPGGVLLLQKGDILDLAGIALIRRRNLMPGVPDGGVWMFLNNKESGEVGNGSR